MTKEGNREPTASVQRRLEFGKVVVFKEGGDCKSKCCVMSAQACARACMCVCRKANFLNLSDLSEVDSC